MKHLENCIVEYLACLVACERCILDCIRDGNQECISLCRDCADICALCSRFNARGSSYGIELHALCAKICNACSKECAKHGSHHDSYMECAEACKKCAKVCEEHNSFIA